MLPNEDSLLNKKKHSSTKPTEKTLDENVYTVEAIRDKKRIKNKWHYFIKWFNYPENQNTWEPKENLMCDELLTKFEKTWKKKKQKEKEKILLNDQEIINLDDSSRDSSKLKVNALENEESFSSTPRLNSMKNDRKSRRNNTTFQKKNYKEENLARDNNINNNNSDDNPSSPREENKETLFDSKGKIELNVPKRILSAKLKEDKTLEFLVMWKKRGGFKPMDSYVSNEELKKHKYHDLIIDFYEMRTRFHNDQSDSKKAGNSNDSTHENK
jgi:hypothetical protein